MSKNLPKDFEGDIMIMQLENQEYAYSHTHDFLEFVYIEEGEAVHDIGGASGRLSKGDYFVVDYNTAHSYFSEKGNLTVINCLFMPELIDKTFTGVKSFNELAERYFLSITGRKIKGPSSNQVFCDDGTVGRLFSQMVDEFADKKEGYIEVLKHCLCTLIIKAVRQVGADRAVSEPTSYIISEIKKNYMNNITLETVCRSLNYSIPYISTRFRQETGLTFTAYLQNKRIEESCALLSESNIGVSEIAERVGYSSVKFFNKVFRRITKMSPREYRRQSRSKR